MSLWGCIICVVAACNTHSSRIIQQPVESTKSKCFFVQELVLIGSGNFEPYLEEYNSFMEGRNQFDMLIKVLGQSPKLIRVTNVEDNRLEVRTLKANSSSEKQIIFDVKALITTVKKSSKFYYCNDGASDFGSEIYLLKIKGELILKIWIENGRYDHLTTNEEPIDTNLNILKDMLSIIFKSD